MTRKIIIKLTDGPAYSWETTSLMEAHKFCRFLDQMEYSYDSDFFDCKHEIPNVQPA